MEDMDEIWKSVTSASVCDALGRICNHRAHVLDLVSPTPGKVLFGPAVTMRMLPLRDDLVDENVNSFSRLFYEAVGATRLCCTNRVMAGVPLSPDRPTPRPL